MTAFHSRTVYAEWLVSAFESRGVAATEIASVLGLGPTVRQVTLSTSLKAAYWLPGNRRIITPAYVAETSGEYPKKPILYLLSKVKYFAIFTICKT
jgi:hypothetical protein